jgi:hypothetical protein
MSLSRLIQYKLKIFLAKFRRGKRRQRMVRLFSLALIGLAFGAFFFGTYGIFKVLHTTGETGMLASRVIITMAFHALLLLAFVFDVAATTNIFFLSSDLSLLMASPLPTLRIFALKYLEALGSGSMISVFIALPVLVGFGIAAGAGMVYYLVMLIMLLLFLTVPVSLGTIFGMLIGRYVPASRVKEVLGVVGAVLALSFWIAFQVIRPGMSNPDQVQNLEAKIQAADSFNRHALLKALPSKMAADAVLEAADPRRGSISLAALQLLGVSAGLIVASVVLARHMYLTGWSRVVPGGRKRRKRAQRSRLGPLFSWLPGLEKAIIAATGRTFIRDPQQVTPIATLTIMMGLFPFFIARRRVESLFDPSLLIFSLATLTFVGAMNLAINATVMDGRSFWILLTAPFSAGRKLRAKYLLSMCTFLPLATMISLIFKAAGLVEWSFVPVAIWLAACVSSVGTATGLLLGLTYADWEWEIPKRMLRTPGRLLMLGIMGVFFAGVSVVIAAASESGSLELKTGFPWYVYPLGAIAAAAVTALLMAVTTRKLERMEWLI